MQEFTILLTACLITFGISHSMANSAGPFSLCKIVRTQLERLKYEFIQEGSECPICWSFWISMAVAFCLNGGVPMWLAGFGFTAMVMSLSPPDPD